MHDETVSLQSGCGVDVTPIGRLAITESVHAPIQLLRVIH